MLSTATNQSKSTAEPGYMCPRGMSGPLAPCEFLFFPKLLEAFFQEDYFNVSIGPSLFFQCMRGMLKMMSKM